MPSKSKSPGKSSIATQAAKTLTAKVKSTQSPHASASPSSAKISGPASVRTVPAKARVSQVATSARSAGTKNSPGSTSAKAAAVIPAQKHATVAETNQPRIPMATSSASKVTKPAGKVAAAKPSVKTTAASVTAKAAPAAKPAAKAASAPVKASVESKPATAALAPAAATAAQFQAQRQAAQKTAPARAMPATVAHAAAQRISVPAAPVAAAAVAAPKDAGPKKPINIRHGFKTNEWIVYPAHGVGRIVAIEEQEIAGMALELFVITFEKDKMTLRVPTGKSASVGMRKLAEESVVKRSMETLKGKARIKRTMWSRRAQEFEQKINSGDLGSIAEVVRDLYRAETQPEQSYSERQLYEAALDRMAREIAAVEKIDERGAVQRITEVLSKSAKSRRAETDATAAAAGDTTKAA
jgi:CarD family transcriptional regulator